MKIHKILNQYTHQKFYLLLCLIQYQAINTAFAQINESDTLRLQSRISLTGAWQKGNVEMLTFRTKLDISVAFSKNFVFKTQNAHLYQEFFRKKADEDLFSRNFIYYKPQKQVYPFFMGFVSSNFRRKINNRYFIGLGLTWQMIMKKEHLVKLALSGVYEQSTFAKDLFNKIEYNGNNKINTWRATFWLFGKHHLFNKKLIFHYDCYAQPSLEKANNLRWQAEVGLDVPIYKGLSFTTNFVYTYESIVVQNNKNEDSILTFGLAYQLKQ